MSNSSMQSRVGADAAVLDDSAALDTNQAIWHGIVLCRGGWRENDGRAWTAIVIIGTTRVAGRGEYPQEDCQSGRYQRPSFHFSRSRIPRETGDHTRLQGFRSMN